MSSHHIVKDKQEPALIIANGEACSSDLMEQLLGWSPFVLVLDGAIERVLELGIKVDALLGDFDSLKTPLEKINEAQYPIEIIHTPDQEKTDLEKGVEFLIAKGFPAVNILWATGRRMDHTLANVFNLIKYMDNIKLVMLDDYAKLIPLKSSPHFYEKWYKSGTPISLIPMPKADGIITTNLRYPLSNESLALGGRLGNSNEVEKDGLVRIVYTSGGLLLIEAQE